MSAAVLPSSNVLFNDGGPEPVREKRQVPFEHTNDKLAVFQEMQHDLDAFLS
jgi:hypothetical protein